MQDLTRNALLSHDLESYMLSWLVALCALGAPMENSDIDDA